MSERTRRIAAFALTGALLVSLVAGRVLVEARRELRAGESAIARSDWTEAIRRLRRAAHWYLPGNPYCARAYEQLENLAHRAEGQGRNELAFSAWRAIRASSLSTRWLRVPQSERLVRANRHIASLLAEMPGGPQDRATDRNRAREEHLALLTQDRAPEPAWLLVMLAGFATWSAAAFWAARNAWDDDDRPLPKRLALSAATVAFGVTLFLLGIANA